MVISELFSNDSQAAWGDISEVSSYSSILTCMTSHIQARTLLTTLTETLDSLGRQLVTFASDSADNTILVSADGIGEE